MNRPPPDTPFAAVRAAMQSVTGASLAMLAVWVRGGAIPTAALCDRPPRADDWLPLAFAWVGHWVVAGLMMWGVLALLVPIWCLHELLHGNRRPLAVLALAFVTQLVISTIAIWTFADEAE